MHNWISDGISIFLCKLKKFPKMDLYIKGNHWGNVLVFQYNKCIFISYKIHQKKHLNVCYPMIYSSCDENGWIIVKNTIKVEIFACKLRISHFILIFSRLNRFNIQMNIQYQKKSSQCLLRKWVHYHEKRNQSRKFCKAKKSYSFIIFENGGLPDSTCHLQCIN
jgi:hypothetical protein